MPRGCICDSLKLRPRVSATVFHATRNFNSGGTSADFDALKQGPASVLFSRFLRPNNSAAAALQLAAPVLQQRTVFLQSHTKNETGNRKLLFLEDLPQKAVVPLIIPAEVKVSALQVPSKI